MYGNVHTRGVSLVESVDPKYLPGTSFSLYEITTLQGQELRR